MPGRVRVWTGSACRLSMILLRRSRVALGMASRMSVTLSRFTTAGISSGENTGTPLMVCPILDGSSSTKPSSLSWPLMAMADAVCTPAVPAPKISMRP